jgi:hypothetical protein
MASNKRILSGLSLLAAGGAWFMREGIKHLFFTWVTQMVSPTLENVVEYGPTIILVLIAFWLLWPAKTKPIPDIIDAIFRVGLPLGYAPLDRTAAKLYGQMQGSAAAEFAQRSSNSPAEILDWFAYWMALKGIRVFGKMPPSPQMQEIPRAKFKVVFISATAQRS